MLCRSWEETEEANGWTGLRDHEMRCTALHEPTSLAELLPEFAAIQSEMLRGALAMAAKVAGRGWNILSNEGVRLQRCMGVAGGTRCDRMKV